jgi:hypothetical protein
MTPFFYYKGLKKAGYSSPFAATALASMSLSVAA